MREMRTVAAALALLAPALAGSFLLLRDVVVGPPSRALHVRRAGPLSIVGPLSPGAVVQRVPVATDDAQGLILLAGTWGTRPIVTVDACSDARCVRSRRWLQDMGTFDVDLPPGMRRGEVTLAVHGIRLGQFALIGEAGEVIAVPYSERGWLRPGLRALDHAKASGASFFLAASVAFAVALGAVVASAAHRLRLTARASGPTGARGEHTAVQRDADESDEYECR